jgi:hypothetical protein
MLPDVATFPAKASDNALGDSLLSRKRNRTALARSTELLIFSIALVAAFASDAAHLADLAALIGLFAAHF